MRLFSILAVLAALMPAAAAAQPAPSPSPAVAKARLAVEWARIKAEGFSGVVRIDLDGEPVLREAAGLADPRTRRPFTVDTQFEIGSLTKPITAAAILKLEDAGMLSVNDPLSKLFPEAPADKGAITLHQLLTHSSGLPMFAAGTAAAPDLEPLDRDGFLKRAWTTPLRFRPGEKILYSNAGYSLLAAVIETVTGQDYETYLRAEVLAPGGAERTGYRSAYDEALAARNRDGATIAECCWGPGPLSWNLLGNGGLVTTADQFVQWRRAFAEGRVVSPAATRRAATGWVAQKDGPGAEGYGWIIGVSPTRGKVEVAAGGNDFFTTEMRHYPDARIITLATTNSGADLGEVVGRLVHAMFGEAPPQMIGPPATPQEQALIDAFAVAVLTTDGAARRAFIAANAGPAFIQRESLAAIVARFDSLHANLAGGALVDSRKTPMGGARLRFRNATGEALVMLRFGGSPDEPRVAGFEPG